MRREHKPAIKNGSPIIPIIPLHERKVKKSMQNAGGFYEGMPGVTTNSVGNRKIIDFIVTKEGDANAYIFAHPAIISKCLEDAMKRKELRNLIMHAVIRHSFKRRFNPLYIIVRLSFRFKKWSTNLRIKRNQRKLN